jgi:UDP-N-acetylglucosamine:LPS N-acetylglucosamine transferase
VIPGDFSDQQVNASYLADQGAAVALTSARLDELESEVLRLLDDAQARTQMAGAMRRLAQPNATSKLATLLQEIAA